MSPFAQLLELALAAPPETRTLAPFEASLQAFERALTTAPSAQAFAGDLAGAMSAPTHGHAHTGMGVSSLESSARAKMGAKTSSASGGFASYASRTFVLQSGPSRYA